MGNRHIVKPRNSLVLLCILSALSLASANGVEGDYYLEGIGYREQELQVAKTTRFASETPSGIAWASMAGGTHIFIKGVGLVDNPQSNVPMLTFTETGTKIPCPPLTEDDAFNSHPIQGTIAYRLPSISEIFGMPFETFDTKDSMSFTLSILAKHELEDVELECGTASNCAVHYIRGYTPTIHYISPRVIYHEAYADFWFDPKSTTNLIQDLSTDEMPFINAKVSKALIDFEFNVDHETWFSHWSKNRIRGQIGELPIATNHTLSMMWETGKAHVLDQYATYCNIDNSSCYQARTVPVIFDVSTHSGFSSGGQNLTVYGHGFGSGNISVTVDGVNCTVTSYYSDSFSCDIQPATSVSQTNGSFAGSHGLTWKFMNESFTPDIHNMDQYAYNNHLLMEFETPYGLTDTYGTLVKGYFVAPKTTNYRFWASCDDDCYVDMGLDTADPMNMTRLTWISGYIDYRDYIDRQHDKQLKSEWVSLVEGEKYYVEGGHIDKTGSDHFTVSVEIEQNDVVGHFNSMKETQYLQMQPNQTFEVTQIEIANIDNGTYRLVMSHPTNFTNTATGFINANATAAELKAALNGWYKNNIGSEINVVRTWYDVNGTETTNFTLADKAIYNITQTKLITGTSVSDIIYSASSTSSSVTVRLPDTVQLSAEPLSGKFRILCNTTQGIAYSEEMSWDQSTYWIRLKLQRSCPSLADNIEVWEAGGVYPYKANGRAIYIRFSGKNGPQLQYSFASGDITPIGGSNVTFSGNVSMAASNNIFYEPVPFDLLRTYETKPQIIVTVNGEPAVCHNMTCDYTYTEPVGEVTSFTWNDASNQLTIVGSDLPLNASGIRGIMFAKSPCSINSVTNATVGTVDTFDNTTNTTVSTPIYETTIVCTLDNEPTIGDHLPQLTVLDGLVNNSASLSAQTITGFISSVSPTSELNLLGNDNLTFTGNHLPWNLATSTVTVNFDNGGSTSCIPQTSTSTSLVCLTQPFDKVNDVSTGVRPTIVINGKTVPNEIFLTTMADAKSGVTLSPMTASPVLKTPINITLESTFPYTLSAADFSINATNISNTEYYRQMNVIAVYDTEKIITVMFGGAYTGDYRIDIRHSAYGLVDTTGLVFIVGSNVTDVSPNTGSKYGGTLLTITGTNFGDIITDNPVQISTLGGVGSIDCFVQTTSATQITCRVDATNKTDGTSAKVITFLKVSEEALCTPNSTCDWVYANPQATLTSKTASFNSATGNWEVIVSGTGFAGDCSATELLVSGRAQTCVSVNSTTAVFAVSNVTSNVLSNMVIYFAEGTPENAAAMSGTLTLNPTLTASSPATGSVGGTILTLSVSGAATGTSGLSVVDGTNTAICQTITIPEYGVVKCHTLAQNIDATVLAVTHDGVTSNCNTCAFEQLTGATYPTLSSATFTSTSLTLTGSDIFTAGYNTNVSLAGIQADSVTVNSATEIVATWSKGLPPVTAVPVVWFESTSNTDIFYAAISFDSTALAGNDLQISSSSSGLQCSFAGGCKLQITSNGLSSLLEHQSNQYNVKVCDTICPYSSADSSDSQATCLLPPMSTVYSDEQYNISRVSEDLRTGTPFGNLQNNDLPFDNNLLIQPTHSTADCEIGLQFKEGHVAIISQVKWFLQNFNKASFQDKTKFQGSNDKSTWTDLFTMDELIHDGWNYYNWEDGSNPKFRYYRFSGNDASGCRINEIKLTGVETIDDNNSQFGCTPVLTHANATTTSLSNAVTYLNTATPLLTAISPRFGSVLGGETVTFSGNDFSSNTADYTITIDGINCPVTAATTTSVTCTTGDRPGLVESSLEIFINGKGLVATQGKLYRYVMRWSEDVTWGGEFAPMHMESVHIPTGLNLLVDVDSTPELNAIVVEGSLIFPPDANPNHERFFDARYIFVTNGTLEAGTEEFPYTSKLTITMHGHLYDPYLPIYGNKVIGVRYGTLDMHGIERTPTWTVMDQTAEAGDTQITLATAVDWQVGEQIAIASTGYNGRDSDKRTIAAIDNTNPDKPVITLDQALEFKHFAKIETYGGEEIDMRAEVGLLTRNVKFRGDPETSKANEYGANIFIHSSGDDSLTARIANVELEDVGQGFKIGRYAVHFHQIGAVHQSYAKGNAVHSGFNRAFTLHGTHYLRIMNNVAYDVKGHNIFIEDAVEKHNYLYHNLVMRVKRSWSGLNTDQTPAGFWITQPDNMFIENHVGGSDRYAYWYDLQKHAIGPNANTDVCPENERVGEFRDNHAHSCGRYGLRIFHNMEPRKFPCKAVTYDPFNTTDPWHKNPPITANFYRLTSWKNGRNGAIAEKVGDVRFHDFKVADNILAGIEFSLTTLGDNMAQINGALIVGRSNNTDDRQMMASPRGIITPRTDRFLIQGIRFHNFDWNNAAGVGSCSHCFHPAATDSGARTIEFKNITWADTVNRRMNYQYPFRAIYKDLDGTLTGMGPNSWATPYYAHLNQTGCVHNQSYYGGIFCDNTVEIRRIAIHGGIPEGIFSGMGLKILRYDDDLFTTGGYNKTEYLLNKTEYATMPFKKKLDPGNGWATPFATGHKYKIHFGMTGLDFEQMRFTMSEHWVDTDQSIYLVHNWTDVREQIDVNFNQNGTWVVPNNSIPSNPADYSCGQNVIYNETEIRETHLIINGKNQSSINPFSEHQLHLIGHRCVGGCLADIPLAESDVWVTKRWSDPNSWPNQTLPAEGEDVMILPMVNMIFDLEESPIFRFVEVNGNITFEDVNNTHFRAKHIFIRAGAINIGTKETPHNHTAKITLYGEKNFQTMAYDTAIEAGNKLIVNLGKLNMYGRKRDNSRFSRLTAPALKDSNTFTVSPGLDWVAGDRLALLATSYTSKANDDVFISSYDAATGQVTINTTLNYYHWGQAESTAGSYNGVDMRGEVLLLSRNVIVAGQDIESWGGQITTGFVLDNDGTMRYGQTYIDNVEIFNCSQIDTEKAAMRWESNSAGHSSVTNSVLHNGLAWAFKIKTSKNIIIKDNIFYNFRPMGMVVQQSSNITIDGNIGASIVSRTTLEGKEVLDVEGVFAICSTTDKCSDISVVNNIAAASIYTGFAMYGHTCGQSEGQRVFRNNTAHSIDGSGAGHGALVATGSEYSDHINCVEHSHFRAYKCKITGAHSFGTSKHVIFSHMTMIDNVKGFGITQSWTSDDYVEHIAQMDDNIIYGESPIPDQPQDGLGGYKNNFEKFGLMLSQANKMKKGYHVTSPSKRPHHKIKSDATWGGKYILNRNNFIDWRSKTRYGKKQYAFGLNEFGPDHFPVMYGFNNKFTDIDDDAFGYFYDPKAGWANVKDCGNFPCTAPWNVLISMKNTLFSGYQPLFAKSNFQLIADNPAFAPYVPSCNRLEENNLWMCEQTKLSMLLFESEDADKRDRSMQPIYVQMQGTEMNSKLNAFMDHVWDGFYTGQVRESRFPAVVYAPKGSVYNLTFTGSPAKKMRFELKSQDQRAGMTVRIHYPSAESRKIIKDGQVVNMNQWDETERMYGSIRQRFCGENRYIGVKNILEFYITQGCTLRISPRNAIQTLVRMEWTFEEFFANGGTTTFMDRIAGSLGIHASTIKVVSVYEGSVVVDYAIENDDPTALEATKEKQTELFATNQMDLGAPILDVQVAVTSVNDTASSSAQQSATAVVSDGMVTAPGFEPIVITQTSTNTNPDGTPVDPEDVEVYNPDTPIIDNYDEYQQNQTQQQSSIQTGPNGGMPAKQNSLTKSGKNGEGESSDALLIIVLAVAVLGVLILAYCARLLYVHVNIEKFKLEAAKQQAMKKQKEIEVEKFDEQYDATQDFAVFGVGDVRGGGLQTLQQKMNLADEKSQDSKEDSSSEEQEDNAKDPTILEVDPAQMNFELQTQQVVPDLPEDKEIAEDEPESEK